MTSLPSRLGRTIAAGRAVRTLVNRADRLLYSRLHAVVTARSDGAGFALFGGFGLRHHFNRLYLGDGAHRLRLAVHSPDSPSAWRQLVSRYGLVVIYGDAAPDATLRETIRIPRMLDMGMDLPDTVDQAHARFARSALSDLAKIKKHDYRVTVESGHEWQREFYSRFYRPSMRTRWGAEAIMGARGAKRSDRAPEVEFLRVEREGQWVAGIVNRSSPDCYRMQRIGWRDGSSDLLRAGVLSAIYWQSICRAIELGHHRITAGAVGPYLSDGLLFFKAKWGMHLGPPTARYGEYRLLLDPAHPDCRRFLESETLLSWGRDDRLVAFSAKRPDEMKVAPSVFGNVARWYRWDWSGRAVPAEFSADVPSPLRRWLISETLPAHH